MSARHCIVGALVALSAGAPLSAQTADVEFFESKIRPVLVQRCYSCHNSKMAAPKGDLVLDTKEGLLKGGVSGPALVPGNPAESRLLQVLSYTDPLVQMPPSGKLPDAVLADFTQWVAKGAVDPRVSQPAVASASPQYKGMSPEEGRKWWAFAPVSVHAGASRRSGAAAKADQPIDFFIKQKLAEKKLTLSPQADKRTLVTRAYVGLLGFKPTYEEVQAFLNDGSPNAYENLIDRLLKSPHYGERWGRHWMDVARYADDNPSSEATNPPYPFAWRYRDWIIEALNADMPYDRFVKLQLAADMMPDVRRDDLRALGYVGAAPIYHHDLRLSGDVIGTFLTDDWDERIDAVSRGVLGLSVACARCHDHKFDPITQKDYYALMGVFASTVRAERPMFAVEPEVEQEFMWLQRKLFDLAYSINLLGNEGTTFTNGSEKAVKWKAEMEGLKTRATASLAKYPQLLQSLDKYWNPPRRAAGPPAANAPRPGAPSTDPYMNAVFDAAQYVDASDPTYTWITYKPGEVRNMPVLKAGNVASPGEIVPRGFPAVLAKGTDTTFKNGSGRLELAERLFTDTTALAARVMVNRVWGWHFGRGLVATASDFGTQGDKPTHPELLDDLAARFIQHGWSLKWLNKEIMMSAAYRQSSEPRAEGVKADEANVLLWRQNPRRLDAEAYRDTLTRSAGLLDLEIGGLPGDIDSDTYYRRAIYGRVSRARRAQMLGLFDFPEATQTAPGRDITTSTLQQIFLMNGAFIQNLAEAAAKTAATATGEAEQIAALYRRILARDPSAGELKSALSYLQKGTLQRYAQILLLTNEEMFFR